MALKSTYAAEEKGLEIEEALDDLDKVIDRVKVLYEQYFMGIQRQPPTHLHTDVERRLRELTQQQIRNTALRYRFLTLQQKHGAYNTYWKRTLREIEAGTYQRSLARLRARVAKSGDAVPEEILAKMPKRMRDAIARDRELAVDKARREGRLPAEAAGGAAGASVEARSDEPDTGSQPAVVVNARPQLDEVVDEDTGRIAAAPQPSRPAAARPGLRDRYVLDDAFGDDDIDAALAALADDAAVAVERKRPTDPPPMARPAPGRVVPPINVLPPGFGRVTPPVGVPVIQRATPAVGVPVIQRATPAVGVPVIQRATPAVGVPVIQRATPAVGVPVIQRATPAVGVPVPHRTTQPLGVPILRPPAAPSPPAPPPVVATAAAPVAARPAAPRPAPAAPSSGIPGMTEADTRALYAKYVKARTLVGDPTEPMTYERLVKTLSSQAPKILREHHSTGVEFNVVVKDNKVVLKAKPK